MRSAVALRSALSYLAGPCRATISAVSSFHVLSAPTVVLHIFYLMFTVFLVAFVPTSNLVVTNTTVASHHSLQIHFQFYTHRSEGRSCYFASQQ